MFKCEHCGCCCRNLDKSLIYASLDRGDGSCKHLVGNYCSIYEDRPMLCRVDECYDKYFSQLMNRQDYYRINKQACDNLRKSEE